MSRKNSQTDESWNAWGQHVLKELERLNLNFEALKEKVDEKHANIWVAINNMKIEIAKLKVKAGIWGLVGGALAVIPAIVFVLLERK